MIKIKQIKDLQTILNGIANSTLWTVIPSFSLNGANMTTFGELDLKVNGVVRFDDSNDKLYYVVSIQSILGGEFEYTLNAEPVGDETTADFINDILDITKLNHYTKGETDTILLDKADLVGGIVPAEQLPSYVDDIIDGYYSDPTFYSDPALTIPIVPESGKIYINLVVDPATSYRWSGSVYVQINVTATPTLESVLTEGNTYTNTFGDGILLGEIYTNTHTLHSFVSYYFSRYAAFNWDSIQITNGYNTNMQRYLFPETTLTGGDIVFPQGFGTLALTSNIPTGFDLQTVLNTGNVAINSSIVLYSSDLLYSSYIGSDSIAIYNEDIGEAILITPINISFENNTYRIEIHPPTLTNNRTINFPDASGTLALSENITLDSVLTAGNTTAQNIVIDNTFGDVATLSKYGLYVVSGYNGDYTDIQPNYISVNGTGKRVYIGTDQIEVSDSNGSSYLYSNKLYANGYDFYFPSTVGGTIALTDTYTIQNTYSILPTDTYVEIDTATSVVTLPTAVGIAGKKFCIINVSSGSITVNTTSSETIGNNSVTNPTSIILLPEEVLEVVSNGTNYRII